VSRAQAKSAGFQNCEPTDIPIALVAS
jgi:hypothetical protein